MAMAFSSCFSFIIRSSSPCLLSPSPPTLSSSSSSFSANSLSSRRELSKASFPQNPSSFSSNHLLCKAAEYVFPDPIPEFAQAGTEKFSAHLLEKLTTKKRDLFGDSIEEVVGVCTEILSNFLHTEYGGPGTLLVIPFIDMADTINERGLPGGPQAARAAVVWAQKHVDKDWNAWTREGSDDLK